jgi:hypothetical protein
MQSVQTVMAECSLFRQLWQNAVCSVILLKSVSLGSYTATETTFRLFVAVLEGFCWNTFKLISFAHLDIIKSTKIAHFQLVYLPGE